MVAGDNKATATCKELNLQQGHTVPFTVSISACYAAAMYENSPNSKDSLCSKACSQAFCPQAGSEGQ